MEALLAVLIVLAIGAAIAAGAYIGKLLPLKGGGAVAMIVAVAGFAFAYFQATGIDRLPADQAAQTVTLFLYGTMLWMIFSMCLMLGNKMKVGKFEAEKELARWQEQLSRDTVSGKPLAIANTLVEIGKLRTRLGSHEEALSAYGQAEGIFSAELGMGEHPTMRSFYTTYAQALRKVGKKAEAEAIVKRFN